MNTPKTPNTPKIPKSWTKTPDEAAELEAAAQLVRNTDTDTGTFNAEIDKALDRQLTKNNASRYGRERDFLDMNATVVAELMKFTVALGDKLAAGNDRNGKGPDKFQVLTAIARAMMDIAATSLATMSVKLASDVGLCDKHKKEAVEQQEEFRRAAINGFNETFDSTRETARNFERKSGHVGPGHEGVEDCSKLSEEEFIERAFNAAWTRVKDTKDEQKF